MLNLFLSPFQANTIYRAKRLRAMILIVLLRTVWDEIILLVVDVVQQDLKLKSHFRIWLCPTAAFMSILSAQLTRFARLQIAPRSHV
jgi:hypothetical protein